MKLKPLKDRVVVSYSEEPDKTAGGLYVPDTAKEKPQEGKVVAVGSEVKEVKKGDVVMGDDEQLVIKEEDILAIVEK
jgi:chaperonin GroES